MIQYASAAEHYRQVPNVTVDEHCVVPLVTKARCVPINREREGAIDGKTHQAECDREPDSLSRVIGHGVVPVVAKRI